MIIPNSSTAGLAWTKSSYSGAQGDCVEVAHDVAGAMPVRDSKRTAGPAIVFADSGWGVFVDALKRGDV
ncbi:DUF397 domain-containing protein [Streptomyces sp. NPDC091376]|uniref:DUF397 domain-containing protein n=1 Tax=Streptomyces sp. NPDC091376 TaxID=3365994 RepID=UPI0037F14C1E